MDFGDFGPMKLWNRFRDDWIVTPIAARLFFGASILTIVIAPLLLGYVEPEGSKSINLFWGIMGAISPFGVLFIWLGMWRYWARVDNSKRWVRRFWFVILLAGFWYGSVPYYFFVYLPQYFRRINRKELHTEPRHENLVFRPGTFGSILIAGWILLFSGTLVAFIFPKAPGLKLLWPLSILLVLSTFLYAIFWLYRLGMNRNRA
jgi:hypothetical protein